MKKIIFASILALLVLFTCSCDNNPTESPTDTTISPTEIHAPATIDREGIMEMFKNESTFDDLKDKYNLEIEGETEWGTLVTICSDIPMVRFYFDKDKNLNAYKIWYIRVFASMVLPEYVEMDVHDIPIFMVKYREKGYGNLFNDILLADDYLRYDVSVDDDDILRCDDLVCVAKRGFNELEEIIV